MRNRRRDLDRMVEALHRSAAAIRHEIAFPLRLRTSATAQRSSCRLAMFIARPHLQDMENSSIVRIWRNVAGMRRDVNDGWT